MQDNSQKSGAGKSLNRLWCVRGVSKNNLPWELKIRAADHNAAVRAASRQRLRVESCVLIEEK